MSFDAGSIDAKLRLNTQQFNAGLQTSLGAVKKFDQKIGAIFRGGLMIGGITFATKQLFAFAESGAALLEVEDAFNRITVASGIAGKSLISLTRGATMALSKREIMETANQLDIIGVSVQKLPELARVAKAVADATGRSTKEILDQLVSGTARTQDRMLRLLGVNVQFTAGMTEEQKQAVFLNQVLGQTADIVQRLGNESVTTADKLDRAHSAFRDWADFVKESMAGSFGAWLGWMIKLRDAGVPTGPGGMIDLFKRVFGGGQKPGTSGLFDALAGAHNVGPDPAQAAIAAQLAAKAYFDRLLRRANSPDTGPKKFEGSQFQAELDTSSPEGGDLKGGGFDNFFAQGIDKASLLADGVNVVADSFAGLFEMLVSDSANAGRAFFAGIMSGISGVASSIGETFIQTGVGMLASGAFGLFPNPWAMIAAGVALKAVAGAFRGIASNNAPVTTSTGERHLRQPLVDTSRDQGNTTFIIEGDFVGDRVWVDRLADKILGAQRTRGTRVIYTGSRA